jgi:hypothetical protein
VASIAGPPFSSLKRHAATRDRAAALCQDNAVSDFKDAGKFQYAKRDQNDHQNQSDPPEVFAAGVGGLSHLGVLLEFLCTGPKLAVRFATAIMHRSPFA